MSPTPLSRANAVLTVQVKPPARRANVKVRLYPPAPR
jgi:hypothetical protein